MTINDNAQLRVQNIIGNPDKNISPLLAISKSGLYLLIKQGKFPRGKRLTSRITVWSAGEVFQAIKTLRGE